MKKKLRGGMRWRVWGIESCFWGLHQAISASASEFYWSKGNLIFYSSGLSRNPPDYSSEDRPMFVFDSDNGTSTGLENCPAYCNLFWPPLEWVVTSSREGRSNDTDSVTSATPEVENMCPDSNLAISTGHVGGKNAERVTSLGQELGCNLKRRSTSSKRSFKFCCF
ncbi:hypothetical protein PTKIN_Ptkin02bG0219900 [Pterospermum kingtungense]